MRRNHEEVQARNKHGLTCNQHVFSKASIKRFAGADDCVAFVNLKWRKVRRKTPSSEVFCAQRVWDQRAEAGYMREIEERFQTLAKCVTANPGGVLSADDNEAASRFFALWRCRAHYRYEPDGDEPLNGVEGQVRIKDREEWLEKHRIGFIRPEGLPRRQIYGVRIERDIDLMAESLQARRWGVLVVREEGLIVPDVPRKCCIPLNPALCLAWGHESGEISGTDARRLNQELRKGCQDYYFCRTAPGLGLPIEFQA